jgi:hypothetical protein
MHGSAQRHHPACGMQLWRGRGGGTAQRRVRSRTGEGRPWGLVPRSAALAQKHSQRQKRTQHKAVSSRDEQELGSRGGRQAHPMGPSPPARDTQRVVLASHTALPNAHKHYRTSIWVDSSDRRARTATTATCVAVRVSRNVEVTTAFVIDV